MREALERLRAEALSSVETLTEISDLEAWRVRYLGRKGELTGILRGLGGLPPEERRTIGALANQVKEALETAFETAQADRRARQLARSFSEERLDVTLPGRAPELGRLHPTTQIVREICAIFASMGFEVVEGPEVEWDRYNFQLLNIPRDHPARDMWDTLWISPDGPDADPAVLLRTHTSPMQARVMEQTEPPVRVVVPGKCYRYEAIDASHESMFYQIEGLAVDRGITFAHLKGTLYEFAKRMFGQDRRVRFRCDYFPFVEPGVDMSVDCFVCQGAGCRLCKETGWIEILGAGMVHPHVLSGVGYDPTVYTGFAFVMGPERVAMLRFGIDDIRHFYANDLRFLRQFG